MKGFGVRLLAIHIMLKVCHAPITQEQVKKYVLMFLLFLSCRECNFHDDQFSLSTPQQEGRQLELAISW